ncbi:hypothetical protein V8E36_006930 [Tilletia maclaganii]
MATTTTAAASSSSSSTKLDAQRDALAALLRRSSGPAGGAARRQPPPQDQARPPPSPPQEDEQETALPPGQLPAGTPRPMPFDPAVPPTEIKPFVFDSEEGPPPRKRIITHAHLRAFLSSPTHDDLLSFLRQGARAITGVPIPSDVRTPQASSSSTVAAQSTNAGIQGALGILGSIAAILDAHPPEVQNTGGKAGSGSASAQGRFGNPTFRSFQAEVASRSDELHRTHFPSLFEDHEEAKSAELRAYFDESWGNARRIDYGSGMELNFVCWLLILYKLGVFNNTRAAHDDDGLSPLEEEEVGRELFLRVFWSYILLMRRIQSTYFLEPAGSHGVWGLDDYHFLPFLLGAAQLSDHPYLRPSSIHSPDILSPPSAYPSQYMYLSQIALLHSIKTIPGSTSVQNNSLRWHSPMLDDISSVKSWAQVERGMWKMLEAEVVGKLPVAQHFLFGRVLAFPGGAEDDVDGGDAGEVDACGHGHHHHHQHGAASAEDGGAGRKVVLDAEGKPLPLPTGHAHGAPAQAGLASNTVDAPQQGGTTGWGDCCGIPIPSAYGAAALAAASPDPSKEVREGGGGVVAETGQLGRAKGWSASPAALAAAAGEGEVRKDVGARRVPPAAAAGVRRIPFD